MTVLPLEDFTTLEMERFTGISPLCPLSGSLYGCLYLVPTLCIEGTSKGMEEGEDNGGRVVVASGDVAESAWLWL